MTITEGLIKEMKKSEEGRKMLEIFSEINLSKKEKVKKYLEWLKDKKQGGENKEHRTD